MQQRTVVKLQGVIGNRAVQRIMSARPGTIQRDDPVTDADTESVAAATTPQTWTVPDIFDDLEHTASTRRDAALACLLMADRLSRLQRVLGEGDGAALIRNTLPSLHDMPATLNAVEDPDATLTGDDVVRLMIAGSFASSAYETGLNTLRTRLNDQFRPVTRPPDFTGLNSVKEQLAERLHSAFNNGTSDSDMQRMRETMETIDGYRGHVDRFISWTGTVTGLFSRTRRASEFLESIGERAAPLSTGIERLTQIVTAADALNRLMGSASTGEAQEGIASFRATLDLIDIGMSFATAVPLLSSLWSNYYSPMTRAILTGLERIYDAADLQARQITMIQWMQRPRPSDEAPIIPGSLMSYFPGGQPVLDFMYAVVNDLDPEVTPAVEQYFIQNIDRFNAGLETGQLETESDSTWYDPRTWGSADRAPGLLRWVRGQQDVVWAQLYGSLPHTLR